MTNFITNTVFILTNSAPVQVYTLTWEDQSHYFLDGLSYGLGSALALAVVWGIIRAVRGSGWFWNSES